MMMMMSPENIAGDDAAPDDEPAAAIDPVCGMEVVDKDSALSVGFHGETLYFCSEACREKFLVDPERYVVTPEPEI